MMTVGTLATTVTAMAATSIEDITTEVANVGKSVGDLENDINDLNPAYGAESNVETTAEDGNVEWHYKLNGDGDIAELWTADASKAIKNGVLVIPGYIDGFTVVGVGSSEENTVKGASAATKLSLPSSVTQINDYAFKECSGLEELILDKNIKVVGAYAFNGLGNLKTITANGATEFKEGSFMECPKLAEVRLAAESKVDSGADGINGAFSGCVRLKNIIYIIF